MPLGAMVSPLSLYMIDDTIFDGLQLPTMPANPTDYPDLYVQGFQLDRNVLIDNILMETGEMSVIYPEPDFFKYAVTQWSKKELHVWQALYNTLFYKYNPLWNKDGTIKETAKDLTSKDTVNTRSRNGTTEQTVNDTIRETDTHDAQDTHTSVFGSQITESRQNTGTQSTETEGSGSEYKDGSSQTAQTGSTLNSGTVTDAGSSGTENKVSAYNENTYQNRDKTDSTTGNTRSDNLAEDRGDVTLTSDASTAEHSSNEDVTRTDNLREDYDSDRSETAADSTAHSGTQGHIGDNSRSSEGSEEETEAMAGTEEGQLDHSLTRTEQGNIGVTMTTQLIAAQRELVQLNFYDLIVERFKERFCLLVY